MIETISEFARGIWLAQAPVNVVGMKLTTTMTVVRFADGDLLLYSPIPLTDALEAEIDELGNVAHVYAPNTFHHMWAGQWSRAYPQACIHAPRGLVEKRPDLRIDRLHGSGHADFRDELDEFGIDGFLLEESVLIHRATRTLIVADLVHNIGRPTQWWARTYAGMMGFYDQLAISRVLRWTAFRDTGAARESVDRILASPIERLVVGHGAPLETGAHSAVETAYDWLEPSRKTLAAPSSRPRRGYCG